MSEFIISSEQLERLIEGIEHDTGREINEVVCDGAELPEIVRCRDCKHYMDYEHECEPNLGYCRLHDMEEVKDSRFCAWGERRES